MFSKIQKAATAAKRTFRIAKNYKKNKKVEREWHHLNATHRVDFMLQYIRDADRGEKPEAATDNMQVDDEDWMEVEHIDPASMLLGSPNAEVFNTDMSFNATIESAIPIAKLERKPKPRVTHEVDGFAVIEKGQASGLFELPSHVDPNRELQVNAPRGDIKKVLREWGSPDTGISSSFPLLSGAGGTRAYNAGSYGNNNKSVFSGGFAQSPATPSNSRPQTTQTATSTTTARPPSLFSMNRATSMAHTFANTAATATDIALQAAGIRDEDAYSESDDDFFLDGSGRPFTGSSATSPTRMKRKTSGFLSAAQPGNEHAT
jgi:hypothetical protein